MIDSIYVALTGLNGHQQGLRVISGNVANMNTPGFRGSTVMFKDLLSGDAGSGHTGGGLDGSRAAFDLRPGETRQTGRDLDLTMDGPGFFVIEDETGARRYTRNGSFEFDPAGTLVGRGTGFKVMARDEGGKLVAVELKGQRISRPKATTEVRMSGNLSSTDTDHGIDSVLVYDALGGAHTLRLAFTSQSTTAPGQWSLRAFEGTTEIGTGTLRLDGGAVSAGTSTLTLPLAFGNAGTAAVKFVFGSEVTGFSSGTTSTLVVDKQDGYAPGAITALRFDADGVLKIGYSNGQSADGAKLVFAQIDDDRPLAALGNGLFAYGGPTAPMLRDAGDDLRVTSQSLELSNVDLTQEFSALILMQRGYQASSQVLSTANEMLQELFDMKGKR